MLHDEKCPYQKAYGDVIMLGMKEKESGQLFFDTGSPGTHPPGEKSDPVFPIDPIRVLSSDDLFYVNFAVLGKVVVDNSLQQGFSKEEVIRNLKIGAFRQYGNKAQGITNIM